MTGYTDEWSIANFQFIIHSFPHEVSHEAAGREDGGSRENRHDDEDGDGGILTY